MLHPKDFIHPEDEAALRNMEAIPGFAAAMKMLMKYYQEQQFHGISMASKIRLSPKQLPDIYNILPPICQRLSIQEPEFYLEMNPMPNAFAFGDTRTMISITSGLLEHLTPDEVRSVVAHECGHVACRHMLYHSLAWTLVQQINELGVLGKMIMPVVWALFYWQRKSELSADRAAAIALCDANKVVETQIRLAGGPKSITKDVNIEEFVAQADYYDTLKQDTWDKLLQYLAIMNASHPFSAVRVREILKWSKTEQYQRLLDALSHPSSNGTCPNCHKNVQEDWHFCKHCGVELK
jgi:Zn-dependent protease with chaperone function